MNKKLLFSFSGLLLTIVTLAQSDSLTVTGELSGQDNQKVSMSLMDDNGKPVYYSATAEKNKFSFKVKKTTQPTVARFNSSMNKGLSKMENGKNVANPALALDLFIFQSDIKIKGTAETIYLASVKGGKENDEFDTYRKWVYEIEKRRGENNKIMFFMDRITDSTEAKKLMDKMLTDSRKQWEIQKKYITDHPASFGSLFLLSRMENLYTTGDYETAFNNLSDEYKNNTIAQKIAKRIEFLSPTAVGKPAVNFIRKDKDGNEINLAQYKGKLVLLDFWGSWCGPCRASHPHLKELYKEYKNKGFEIIAIANETAKTADEQKAKWLEAIQKDEISWIHILNNDGAEIQNIVKDYRVTAFPTKILLDKDGKILLRITASATDDIDKTLEKYLGK